MRRLVAMAVLPAICAAGVGCCSCGPKAGWSFQAGRPATVAPPVLVGPQVTTYGLSGMAAMPAYGAALAAPVGLAAACSSAGTTRQADSLGRVAPDPCASISVEELCRRLVALETAVKAIKPPAGSQTLPKPMPRGAED